MTMIMMQSIIANETKSNNGSDNINCAKACPCGVPVIPVPDQWLEVMVTGGFKVWHIIFIIIAFITTMTVVYCCFHRCRIPRTKQEIEADLMRTNLATKFSDYLQEIPNEPTTFAEALKKVQELEEKMEEEDNKLSREMGARKRMGWLNKLNKKGDKGEQGDKEKVENSDNPDQVNGEQPQDSTVVDEKLVESSTNDLAPVTNLSHGKDVLVPINTEKETKEIETKLKEDSGKTEAPIRKRRNKPGLSRTKASGRVAKPSLDLDVKLPTEENLQLPQISPPMHSLVNFDVIENGQQQSTTLTTTTATTTATRKRRVNQTRHKVKISSKNNEKTALVLNIRISLVGANGEPFPSIMTSIGVDKSYHLMFQIRMEGSNGKITAEEWASFEDELFRFDLISDESRVTFLTYGRTGEVFRFSPYECQLLKLGSKDFGILGNLFQGYSLDPETGKDGTYAYGMGPLWFRAEAPNSIVTPLEMNTAVYNHKYISYLAYNVKFSTSSNDKVSYDTRFFFKPQKDKFIDIVDWTDPVQNKIIARAKVISYDVKPLSRTIFDIPVGYGCKRPFKYDAPLNVRSGLNLLKPTIPNQAVIDVTVSRPKDELLHIWATDKYTVRLMTGSIISGPYFDTYWSTSTQSRDADTLRLKRNKLVWAAQRGSEQAVVYSFDGESGNCSVDHQIVEDHIRLTFPIHNDDLAEPMSIGTDLIVYLFDDVADYHLIREIPGLSKLKFVKHVIYEKRYKDFREVSADGSTVWTGPISVVKEISYMMYPGQAAMSYQTKMTIFFLSSDLTNVLYKAVIDLIEQETVDMGYMLKRLDVGNCFMDQQKSDIFVTYPIETPELMKKLVAIQDIVKVLFLESLFSSTPILPIQISNVGVEFDNFNMYIKLTLLDIPLTQLFNLRRDITLIEREDLPDSTEKALIEQLAPSIDKCASSCDHYQCQRFSYDPFKQKCNIEMIPYGAKTSRLEGSSLYEYRSIKIKNLPDNVDQISGKSHLRPKEIVELLNDLITMNDEENSSTEPDKILNNESKSLMIKVEKNLLANMRIDDPPTIDLRPILVESDLDSMNEFLRKTSENASKVVTMSDMSNFRTQYNILLEGKVFYDKGDNRITGISYEQCEQYCDDSDCKSFSYCDNNQACQVTNFHSLPQIGINSFSNARCKIFSLDYLTKFENFGRVHTPLSVKKSITQLSLRDCAKACMEEDKFNCHGFYLCDGSVISSSKCLLKDRHLEGSFLSGESMLAIMKAPVGQNLDVKLGENCVFYSRSYLAQFDEYHGKAIEFPDQSNEQPSYETIENVGAESCGRFCMEKDCLAFDVCLDPSVKPMKQTCQLAQSEIRKTYLKSKKHCTTFVLSDKSQFNRKNIKLTQDTPDRPALVDSNSDPNVILDQEEQKDISNDIFAKIFDNFNIDKNFSLGPIDGSHWIAKLMSLLFGVILGAGIVGLWHYRDNIYVSASSQVDKFRHRI